jgi:hypothetical protein
MITISSDQGLVRVLGKNPATYGFHRMFGFISESAGHERAMNRKMHGLKSYENEWLCRFKVEAGTGGAATISLQGLDNCEIKKITDASWELLTGFGHFVVSFASAEAHPVRLGGLEKREREPRVWLGAMALSFLTILAFIYMPRGEIAPVAPEVIEQITVKIEPEVQKQVTVPSFQALPNLQQQMRDTKVRRAVEQNLGFLGILGRKDLTKALGGAPTQLKDASAGAGAGGMEGSGGERLVGLGEGVKRTTVGNSGVAGLGGVGTKGAGGGAGGYGNSMVGSGEGKGLSQMALSNDIVLEGGLDRAVIQATIAKYISQVRACYEELGLRQNPGLSGQVGVNFEIGPAGRLNFAKVGKSTLGHPGVEGCITQRMMNWQFPKPLGGVNVKVNYPFMLRPVSS